MASHTGTLRHPDRGAQPDDSPDDAPRRRAGRLSTNHRIAAMLREAADLLDLKDVRPFSSRSYRRAADTLEHIDDDVDTLVEAHGLKGLLALPTIGRTIAGVILEVLQTGKWSLLERLTDEQSPQRLFESIPGIGPGLARRIQEHLGIETLEALEIAAHDGSLEQVPGLGKRRAAAIRAILEGMFSRRKRRDRALKGPPVEVLLDVDAEFREKAEAGELYTIAPKRFNPEGEAWLPVMQTRRDGWRFRALYSNTAQAHKLGRTHDWVVLYYTGDDERGQYTVVTETQGPMAGKRVVRGREQESRGFHARLQRLH